MINITMIMIIIVIAINNDNTNNGDHYSSDYKNSDKNPHRENNDSSGLTSSQFITTMIHGTG